MKAFAQSLMYFFVICIFLSCQSGEASPESNEGVTPEVVSQAANEFIGTWRLLSWLTISPDGTRTERDTTYWSQLKLYTPTHYSYYTELADGEMQNAGVGIYRYEDGKLLETSVFNTNKDFKNVEVESELEWEGPDRYIQTRIGHITGTTYVGVYVRVK